MLSRLCGRGDMVSAAAAENDYRSSTASMENDPWGKPYKVVFGKLREIFAITTTSLPPEITLDLERGSVDVSEFSHMEMGVAVW